MRCHWVDIPPLEPSLTDEGASQNSHNHTGCLKEEMLQPFLGAAAVSVEQVDVLEKGIKNLKQLFIFFVVTSSRLLGV